MRALGAFLAAALVLVLAGCDKRAHCTGYNGSTGNLLSAASLTGCSDQKNRDIRCARGEAEKPFACTCMEGGTTGTTFMRTEALPRGAENLSKLGAEQCDWAIK